MVSVVILATGGNGQLATALAADPEVEIVGRPAFDLDRPESIVPFLDRLRPQALVNAAAYTAVDQAEGDPDTAFRANRDGPAALAALCAARSILFIHISTDYVFDGSKGAPYVEDDPTNPLGVYGRSKREGEIAVLAAMPDALIVRTSWVYALQGRNFVHTMLNAARARPRLKVVADQRGCPTFAGDLAAVVLRLARLASGSGGADLRGIFHAAGSGETTWFTFAEAIFAAARKRGLPAVPVDPITTEQWPTPARRPADSRLACPRLAALGLTMPHWQDALSRMIAALPA